MKRKKWDERRRGLQYHYCQNEGKAVKGEIVTA